MHDPSFRKSDDPIAKYGKRATRATAQLTNNRGHTDLTHAADGPLTNTEELCARRPQPRRDDRRTAPPAEGKKLRSPTAAV